MAKEHVDFEAVMSEPRAEEQEVDERLVDLWCAACEARTLIAKLSEMLDSNPGLQYTQHLQLSVRATLHHAVALLDGVATHEGHWTAAQGREVRKTVQEAIDYVNAAETLWAQEVDGNGDDQNLLWAMSKGVRLILLHPGVSVGVLDNPPEAVAT